MIVDLREFPKIRFVPLDSKALLRLVWLGKLTPAGISPKRFDAWLEESFAIGLSHFNSRARALLWSNTTLSHDERGWMLKSEAEQMIAVEHGSKGVIAIHSNQIYG